MKSKRQQFKNRVAKALQELRIKAKARAKKYQLEKSKKLKPRIKSRKRVVGPVFVPNKVAEQGLAKVKQAEKFRLMAAGVSRKPKTDCFGNIIK